MKSTIALAAVLMVTSAIGSTAHSSAAAKRQLLVTTKLGTTASVQEAVKGYAKLLSKDSGSALFRIEANPGLTSSQLRQILRHGHKVSIAINGDPGHFDRNRDEDVADYVTYLQARAKYEKKDKEAAGLDWWTAYQHWLHDHVNKQGFFDPNPFIKGARHREGMPVSTIGEGNGRFVNGNWSYVGTHNEQPVPGRLFDGLGPITGRVNAVAVNPVNNNIIYVGSAGGGLWKSTDKGATWSPRSDSWQFLQVSSIAIDPVNPNNVYVGTGDFPQNGSYSFGIMKSSDGGTTWTNYGSATFSGLAISKIVVDPSNPSIVIATAGRGANPGGVFRSTNSGATWSLTNAPQSSYDGLDVSQPANGVRTYWAVGESTSGALVYKSVNEGASWTKVTTPIAGVPHSSVDIACSKISAGTVYLLDPDSSATFTNNHVWKTINGGASWTNITAGFPNGDANNGLFYTWNQNNYNFYIGTGKINNGGTLTDGVYIGLITIVMSPDGGATWQDYSLSYQDNNTALSHVDQHAFCADPLADNTVYFGNDGGAHRAVYDPNAQSGAFTPLNLNLYITQWYKVALHPTDSTRITGGLQDNANPSAVGNLNTWINPGQGDGGFVAYDPFNPLIAYNSDQSLSVFRTTNGWASAPADISDTNKYNNETMNQFPPVVLANRGTGPSVLFAGTDHLWKWDPTNLWQGDLGGQVLTGANVRIIATCPNNNTRLYTGSDDGQMWETPNLGTSWTQIDGGFAGTSPIVAISPSPTNAADVLAGTTQTPGPNLFRCTNVDSGAPVWVSVSGSGGTALPAVPINTIARDPNAPLTTWFVGTDVGVFVTTNSGGTWANLTAPRGLPNATVNDLQVNKTTGALYAATYGRGLWKIALGNNITLTAPTGAVSGNPFTAKVSLPSAAPAGGVLVNLASDSALLTVPSSVPIYAGSVSASFTVGAPATLLNGPTVAHITARQGGTTSVATVYVYPASFASFKLSSNNITGGTDNPTATLTLNAPAPANFTVTLSSSDPATASVPLQVTVPAGSKTATFTVTSSAPATSPETVTLTAKRIYTATVSLTVN